MRVYRIGEPFGGSSDSSGREDTSDAMHISVARILRPNSDLMRFFIYFKRSVQQPLDIMSGSFAYSQAKTILARSCEVGPLAPSIG
jgi:hypothetical protein